MAQDVMILMHATSIIRQLEGVGYENLDLFGPKNGYEQNECHLGPKKLNVPSNGFARMPSAVKKQVRW
jgi:hypothetical protein